MLQRLVRLDLPVPSTVALSFEMVKSIAAGHKPDLDAILNQFSPDDILCVRPSSESADWGGPSAILNIGMNDARYVELSDKLGQEAAVDLYLRFVQSYSINVARWTQTHLNISRAKIRQHWQRHYMPIPTKQAKNSRSVFQTN